ncbi:MAG TPA: amidohydrolase family protein, partial [Burkholderiaceae bacterium]|nr:amidohydrolase family protein [Burkholderiaceae bacterium]
MRFVHDPLGTRLPVKLDSTSNGEFSPVPLDAAARAARYAAFDTVAHAAGKLNVSRRAYLVSLCGAAATLAAFDRVFAAGGARGGRFSVPAAATFELAAAQAAIGSKNEFIFDVQLHDVDPSGAWRQRAGPNAMRGLPNSNCGEPDHVRCFSSERLFKDVFLDSDTSMGVLSHVPGTVETNPLSREEAAATKRLIDALDGTERLLLHGRVHPNVPGELERMDAIAAANKLVGWKTYTQFGPKGGYWLDDEAGLAMIEKARKLGIRNICVHKGIPLGQAGIEYAGCRDVGAVAKRFPDMNFIVYHAGFDPARQEGAHNAAKPSGVDTLIDSLREHGIAPNRNVYAELGSTWRFVMRKPDAAAHLLGKLLVHVGDANVLWGTDSIWYGSPQDQIQAFRAFEITREFQDQFGYPALTPERKHNIFGL